MPTLAELSDPQRRAEESRMIARMATTAGKSSVAINHGFRNDADLIRSIEEGYSVPFDYNRLLEEVERHD
jgi:hypothetical protein